MLLPHNHQQTKKRLQFECWKRHQHVPGFPVQKVNRQSFQKTVPPHKNMRSFSRQSSENTCRVSCSCRCVLLWASPRGNFKKPNLSTLMRKQPDVPPEPSLPWPAPPSPSHSCHLVTARFGLVSLFLKPSCNAHWCSLVKRAHSWPVLYSNIHFKAILASSTFAFYLWFHNLKNKSVLIIHMLRNLSLVFHLVPLGKSQFLIKDYECPP